MRQLVKEIRLYNKQYYQLNAPTISDQQYDELKHELIYLETTHPEWTLPNSPTQQIGDDQTKGFAKVKHAVPMLSLDNTYSLPDLQAFGQRLSQTLGYMPELVCEPKYDGVAIAVTYRNGQLAQAVTRGNGQEGDDVTQNVRTIASLPHTLQGEGIPNLIEFRGEVFMPRNTFHALNAEREAAQQDPFINPRNTAAGSLKLHDHREVARRRLACAIYHVVPSPPIAPTHAEALARAASWGIPICERIVRCETFETLAAQIEEWNELRPTLPFDTDGMVVKVNNYDAQQTLGHTATSPRWAIAYKYPNLPVATQLLDVQFQVTRTGAIIPVAILQRVPIGGVYVQRATLHNADYIARLDLHHGDTVLVERGGEVIPKVLSVDPSKREPEARPVRYPHNCPACNSPLQRDTDNAITYCPNTLGCPHQRIAAIIHFASKHALNISGLAETTVHTLYQYGAISTIESIYALTIEKLREVDEAKKKDTESKAKGTSKDEEKRSAKNLINAIEASKQAPLSCLLYGLGIHHIGITKARMLARHYRNMEALLSATHDELAALPNVGNEVAASIVRYFSNQANIERIIHLKRLGLNMHEDVEDSANTLQGLQIVVSGSFPDYHREAILDLIQRHGGRTQSVVTATTSFLVAGERAAATKLKEAEQLGIPTITLQQLMELINPEPNVTL